MAITKAKKIEILEKLSHITKGEGTKVFVNFKGLSVSEVDNLRQTLREQGIGYFVAKKTLVKKAFSEVSYVGEFPDLPGELAVAYGEGDLETPREVYKLQKKLKGKITITGGVFENEFSSTEKMVNIASIPPQEVLYGQLANLLQSPIQRFAIVLSEIAKTK